MARRRRRGGRRRGGINVSPQLIGATVALALLAFFLLPEDDGNRTSVKEFSEHDVFVIDSTSHDQAEILTRGKIFERMADPFGSHIVGGKEISERGAGLAAEISVIVITSQTNLTMRKDIITQEQVDDTWNRLLGSSNYSRASDIYKAFISPTSPIWQEIVKLYFLEQDSLPTVSSCSGEIKNTAKNLAAQGGNFSRTLGYLDRAVDGGADGAWTIICKFASSMKTNYLEIGEILDLASAACHDGKDATKDKCSDVPGATALLQAIVEEKSNWISSNEKGVKRSSIVCAYFGSDMITNSEDNNTEYLDIRAFVKAKTFPQGSEKAADFGAQGAYSILGNYLPSKVKVRIYAPNIGDTQNLGANIGGVEGMNFVKNYWTSYFAEGFRAEMSSSAYGCEGNEIDFRGGN